MGPYLLVFVIILALVAVGLLIHYVYVKSNRPPSDAAYRAWETKRDTTSRTYGGSYVNRYNRPTVIAPASSIATDSDYDNGVANAIIANAIVEAATPSSYDPAPSSDTFEAGGGSFGGGGASGSWDSSSSDSGSSYSSDSSSSSFSDSGGSYGGD